MSRKRKLKNRMARLVIEGKVTVNQGRAVLGRKPLPARGPARPAVQKSAGPAGPVQVPPVPRYAGDEEYLRSAFRPVPRPPVTKAAVPAPPRESPQQVLKALKSWRSPLDVPAGPVRSWTPAEAAMLREAEMMSDPQDRESVRSHLMARLEGSVT